jgi:hypothetical protein
MIAALAEGSEESRSAPAHEVPTLAAFFGAFGANTKGE